MDKAYFCSMLKDNIYRKKQLIRSLLGVAALVATLYSCASMGRPDGGPFDETPPPLHRQYAGSRSRKY